MSKIREIIEKYSSDDNNEWCDVYQSIKDHDFDKLEKELEEYVEAVKDEIMKIVNPIWHYIIR